jgi:hypothetical protein
VTGTIHLNPVEVRIRRLRDAPVKQEAEVIAEPRGGGTGGEPVPRPRQAWELPGRQARTDSENKRNPALPIEDHFFDPEAEPSAGPPKTRASHARTAARASHP